MPLPDNEWTRGKCALKAIQYSAWASPWSRRRSEAAEVQAARFGEILIAARETP